MRVQAFKVTLLEDVIISQRAATEGGHGSLDYLSGATLSGAMAARLYAQLKEEAYTVFHSGKVRFGNALPLSQDGQLTYPTPLCWYKKKHESRSSKMEVRNYQHAKYSKTIVPEQIRGGYVSFNYSDEQNRFTKVAQQIRLKTAIDADKGVASDSQLFAYNSLPEGQQFVFYLEADVEQNLFDVLVSHLLGEMKLGRSRSAEYGAVNIEIFVGEDERRLPETESKEVTLWLLADAALQDQNGQTVLCPTAESVGLPAHFKLDLAKTFVRSRRYAPFNAFRRRRELEREVLIMGSVLHFSSDQECQALNKLQEQGIGLYRQIGLGRVWVNPPLLADKTPNNHWRKIKSAQKKVELIVPKNDVVFRFLKGRQKQFGNTSIVETTSQNWKKQLEGLYHSARNLSYTPAGVVPGPTATQWGQVLEIAKIATPESLENALFEGEQAVCKQGDLQWSKRIYLSGKTEIDSFRKWFRHKISNEKQRELLPQIVARFARLAIDFVREEVL